MEQFCQLVLVQFGTDDTDLTGNFRLTASDVMLFGNIIIIYPGSVGSGYHTLGTQDCTVLSAVQSSKDLLDVLCAVGVGCLDTPTGEYFVCVMVMMGGTYMMVALMLFVLTLLVRSNFLKSHSAEQKELRLKNDDCYSVRDAINDTVGVHLQHSVDLYEATVKAFLNDNESALRKIKSESADFFDMLSRERSIYYDMAQQRKSDTKLDRDARYCYYRAYTGMREVGSNLQKLTTTVKDHIANRHRVYKGELKANLIQLASDLQKLGRAVKGRHALESVKLNGNDIILEIDRMQENLLSSIATENISMRGCELYLNFLQFARELVNRYSIVAVLQHELNDLCDRAKSDDKTDGKPDLKADKPVSHSGPQNILRALHVTGFGKKS